MKFYFFSTFRKITVGGFVNQLIKKFWPKHSAHVLPLQQLNVQTRSQLKLKKFTTCFCLYYIPQV